MGWVGEAPSHSAQADTPGVAGDRNQTHTQTRAPTRTHGWASVGGGRGYMVIRTALSAPQQQKGPQMSISLSHHTSTALWPRPLVSHQHNNSPVFTAVTRHDTLQNKKTKDRKQHR